MSFPLQGRIQIVGSGAIGSIIAANAQRHDIAYSLAPRTRDQLTQRLITYSGQSVLLNHNLPVAERLQDSDLLIFPLKAHQLQSAAQQWQQRVSPDTPVLLLHNGMGGLESVREVFKKQPIYLATTSHGAIKLNPHEVKHTGFGRTMVGEAPDNYRDNSAQSEMVMKVLSRCLQPVTWQQDIVRALWLKLAINAVINPLTAINDIPNGKLDSAEFKDQIGTICEEVAQVACACGIQAEATELQKNVQQVIINTAENYSSMHQDLARHRPTENEAINGFVVRQAEKKGIDVPVNAFLYNKITELEADYS
ncbi:2-dehydropantoate 2-reductase [Salinimonas marina]|uniref:2-dehydropantoate 2-reductase n=1 Tax=Salinimonas marina TaxID=2785918 RepID=A0A7S9DW53_9ALTE|nr:2-dehydropantoate 2-reductase [Salinimonas marina]QPG04863.1 2-dehydropantoate 2-reductase [Salinimonas marina]